ncbi:MAG: hypothetical protein LBH81_03630 [Rickettsiales bacterium]|nr:hypothetical protein [Rickettsiales bacterium]
MRKALTLVLLTMCLFSAGYSAEDPARAARNIANQLASSDTPSATRGASASTRPTNSPNPSSRADSLSSPASGEAARPGTSSTGRTAVSRAQTGGRASAPAPESETPRASRSAINRTNSPLAGEDGQRNHAGRHDFPSEQNPRIFNSVDSLSSAAQPPVGGRTTTASRTAAARGQIQPMVGSAPISGALRGRSAINKNNSPLAGESRGAARSAVGGRTARSAVANAQVDINTPYGKCRASYFSCMDEFCANRDAQFRRCACSARVEGLMKFQTELEGVQNMMKDYNENLLLVGVSAEQAVAAMQASGGEDAFGEGDTGTANKNILNKLSADIDRPTKPKISEAIRIDMDMNFAMSDEWAGGQSRARELFGKDLYDFTAASCKKISADDCGANDLGMAVSAYQMSIEQDCLAVERGYGKIADNAMRGVAESGALLDEARLNADQIRNSDTASECRTKLEAQMRLPGVCGPEYELCIDVSGRFVNKGSGKPILTPDFWKIEGDAAKNVASFRRLLESKRPLVSRALAACQKDADAVWTGFADDFIGNVKVAQTRMLDFVRQDCTKLIAACYNQASAGLENISDLSLSVLAVESFASQKVICQNVTDSCQAILKSDVPDLQSIVSNQERELLRKKCLDEGKNCIMRDCIAYDGRLWLGCIPGEASNEACDANPYCRTARDNRARMIGEPDGKGGSDYTLVNEHGCLTKVRACAGESFKPTLANCGKDENDKAYRNLGFDNWTDCMNTDHVVKFIWGDWRGDWRGDWNSDKIYTSSSALRPKNSTVLNYFYHEFQAPEIAVDYIWNDETCALMGNDANCLFPNDQGFESATTQLKKDTLVAREMLKRYFIENFNYMIGSTGQRTPSEKFSDLETRLKLYLGLKGDITQFADMFGSAAKQATTLWQESCTYDYNIEDSCDNKFNNEPNDIFSQVAFPSASFLSWLAMWPKNRTCPSGRSNNQNNSNMFYSNAAYAYNQQFFLCADDDCSSGSCPGGRWGGLFDRNKAANCDPGKEYRDGDCGDCREGYYKPNAGTAACTLCNRMAADKNNEPVSSGAVDCVACKASPGQYCAGGALKPCPVGYKCPGGEASAAACLPGETSNAGSSSCRECVAGEICPGGAAPGQCPFMNEPTTNPLAAWSGSSVTYIFDLPTSPSRAASITACSRTMPCRNENDNSIGIQTCWSQSILGTNWIDTYTSSCGTTTCRTIACGQGMEKVGETCAQCPAGKYKNTIGDTACLPCADGYYSDSPGRSLCSPCPTDKICPDKASSPELCGQGNWCASNTRHPCAAGTYSAQPSRTTQCDNQCPAGYYCPPGSINGSVPGNLCKEGCYCPQGSGASADANCQNFCNAGYLCLAGSITGTGITTLSNGKTNPCGKDNYCPLATSIDTLTTERKQCDSKYTTDANDARLNGQSHPDAPPSSDTAYLESHCAIGCGQDGLYVNTLKGECVQLATDDSNCRYVKAHAVSQTQTSETASKISTCPSGCNLNRNTAGIDGCAAADLDWNMNNGKGKRTCWLAAAINVYNPTVNEANTARCDSITTTSCNAGYKFNSAGSAYNQCEICPIDTYKSAESLATACTACADGYTTNNGQGKTNQSDCIITCPAGQYVATAGHGCVAVPAGTYSSSHTVAQGSISPPPPSDPVKQCPDNCVNADQNNQTAITGCRNNNASWTVSNGAGTMSCGATAASPTCVPSGSATTQCSGHAITSCNAGYYMTGSGTAAACTAVGNGYASPQDSLTRTQCAAPTGCSNADKSACVACP